MATIKQAACRECGVVGKVGNGGRCSDCGRERMILAVEWSGLIRGLSNREIAEIVNTHKNRSGGVA